MELAKVLGMEKDVFKQVKTFSGGMKRKLENHPEPHAQTEGLVPR